MSLPLHGSLPYPQYGSEKGLRRPGDTVFHLTGPARESQAWALCDPDLLLGHGYELIVGPWDGTMLLAAEVPESERCAACWHAAWSLN